MLNGFANFLRIIDEHWTEIVVIVGLIITIAGRIITLVNKSKEERIEIAKEQVKSVILKMVADAEAGYEDWNKAGSIKRATVIADIFVRFPILSKVVDQEALIGWIDHLIDESLVAVRNAITGKQEQ